MDTETIDIERKPGAPLFFNDAGYVDRGQNPWTAILLRSHGFIWFFEPMTDAEEREYYEGENV